MEGGSEFSIKTDNSLLREALIINLVRNNLENILELLIAYLLIIRYNATNV